jgi:triacylglycerol esterase/lipase EstA (alpha/beta hydrolase family)
VRRTNGRKLAPVAALTAALALSLSGPASVGAKQYTVPWTFDAAIAAQAQDPNSAPPGANDFSCDPRRAHPNPVVLVHGLAANQTVNWRTISPFLANRGYCVFSLTYGTKDDVDTPGYQPGGLVRMQDSAKELGGFVDKVLRRTGAEKVDIVGHSEGSLMPSWYVRFLGGARNVDKYVAMTPLWEGTNPAGLATLDQIGSAFGVDDLYSGVIGGACASCRQFLQNSDFMKRLHSRGTLSPKVDYTTIVTRNDELVFPYTSGLLPKRRNVDNHVVQDECPLDQAEHLSVAADPIVTGLITNALDPGTARVPPCVPVTPFVGAVGYSGN